MELRLLRYFLAVAQEESITRAAEMLHITQPTLSRQLAQLEEETGVTLFRRGSRRITLTDEGLLLRRRAEEILSLADKTARELTEQNGPIEGCITIGSGELASARLLAEFCGSFRQTYPRVSFDLCTATADVVKERMERGLIDIGLLLEPVDIERFSFIRLPVTESWAVLMRPDDPLAAKQSVTAADLHELPLILPRRMPVQSELAGWFGPDFSRLQIAYTEDLSSNGGLLVQGGYGYALVIEGSVACWDPARITARPLSPALSATSVLAWRREQPLGKAAEAFLAHVRQFLSNAKKA